jgi:pimeloyl-ACP methyl ester carboxylesterase
VFDATTPLRRYSGPKFAIVTPHNDTPLSLHNAVPDFQYAVISGTGHWIHLDKPDEFLRVLDGFISR